MITKLYDYFGVLGILSILVWVTTLVLIGMSSRRRSPSFYGFLALGFAVAGWMLALVNSSKVSAIELDQRDEMAAAAKARETVESADGSGVAPTLRFAEGDPEEAMQGYRKSGKQVRQKSQKLIQTKGNEPVKSSDQVVEEPVVQVKYLPQSEYLAANRLDRFNLFMVRLILWLAIGRIVVDYLKRFNSTFGGYWPLPIAGRWLDKLFEKKYAVLVQAPAIGPITPQSYAERVVKKGESFIYFGENDLWAGRDCLARIAVGRWSLWCLPKLDYGDQDISANGEYVLDAAWFNRCNVVVRGEDGFPLFEHIVELVSLRHDAGASARKTVHLIWDLPQVPTEDMILPLIRIAPETNVKLVVWSYSPVESNYTGLFEECPDTSPKS